MRIRAVKRFTIEACHKLPYHKGACGNLHGHSYKLEVAVERMGPIPTICDLGPEQGMVMDFGTLTEVVESAIVKVMDHGLLNQLFANPTAEVMAQWIATEISPALEAQGVRVAFVRLYETEKCYVEVEPDALPRT